MPTYQYACTACGEQLEVVQSFTDDALTQCPACETGRLRKLFGNVGVVFKGSGFYRTDSRSSGKAGGSSGSGGSTDSGSGSSSSGASTSSSSGSSSSAPAKAGSAA